MIVKKVYNGWAFSENEDKKAKINIIILDECYQKNNFNIINEYDGKDTLENNERIVVLINKR